MGNDQSSGLTSQEYKACQEALYQAAVSEEAAKLRASFNKKLQARQIVRHAAALVGVQPDSLFIAPESTTTQRDNDSDVEDPTDQTVVLSSFQPRKARRADSFTPAKDFIGFDHVSASPQALGELPTQTSQVSNAGIPYAKPPSSSHNSSDVSGSARINSSPIPGRLTVASHTEHEKPSNAALPNTETRQTQSAFTEERRSSLPAISKKKKKTLSMPHSPDAATMERSTADERPPKWYLDTPQPKTRAKNESNVDTLLRSLREQTTKCKRAHHAKDQASLLKGFDDVRTKLHTIAFTPVTAELLRGGRMLHDSDGLPQLFDSAYTNGVEWPFDIRADAIELYNKWCRKIFETDLFRGINFKAQSKKEGGKTADSLDRTYAGLVSAKYHGNGDLLNGQWWPTQLCALRDGAHGSSQAGISGKPGEGAYSCIMSGGLDAKGQKYPDEDHGEWVFYTGTDSTDGKIADFTRRMLESVRSKPVRLIRSHNLDSEYAPIVGFRYDGLYDVVDVERLDPETSDRQRHRFRLVRQAGQDPIRGGEGPERRPTEQEVEELRKHQRNLGR